MFGTMPIKMHTALIAGTVTLLILLPVSAGADSVKPAEKVIENPWSTAGKKALQQALSRTINTNTAKNVIVFLGDGMSLATVNAARIYEGQQRGQSGEENRLSFEQFPYTGVVKTYNTDAMVPDSAGTMSAIMTGVKTKAGVISLDDDVRAGVCDGDQAHRVTTALERAELSGKATGVVSTARLTHATPAATYAHSPNREWESDANLSAQAVAAGCRDIAHQFLAFATDKTAGDGIEVALGGGRAKFLPNAKIDPEYADKTGERKDGRDLILEWQQRYPEGQWLWSRQQFNQIDPSKTKRVLGLFEPSHMQYESQRGDEPSLTEMTEKAVQILQKNKRGFFLMVEGGRIDHAHHAGNARNALNETVEFAKAVARARALTDAKDTLIIVTADHGHGFTMAGGYARRGDPVLGLVQAESEEHEGKVAPALDLNGLPYTLLNYVNGPGFGKLNDKPHTASARVNLQGVDVGAWDYRQEALIPFGSETHSGEDVLVYADGPWAHLFTGSIEQNALFHLMQYAAQEKK